MRDEKVNKDRGYYLWIGTRSVPPSWAFCYKEGEVLLFMNAMAPYVSSERSSMQQMLLFPSEALDFFSLYRIESRNTKYKAIRSSCVSSVSVTCMRRTCIVSMRTVVGKNQE